MADISKEQQKIKQVGGFELLEKVGQGAMGTVFKARQISMDRIVALKILPPSIAQNQDFIRSFLREARVCGKLNHPNVVQGIDVGQDTSSGLWFFAMEFIDGPSLRKILQAEGKLPERRVLEIGLYIAKALDAASRLGIVHRDIKPDNILTTSDGEIKLADLGLAQLAERGDLTNAGKAVGTPFYMSPEQARGETERVDVRSDIYALGCSLYHLITGEPPYSGQTSAVVLTKHLTEKVPLAHRINSAVSEQTSRLIALMMAKAQEDRIQTPEALIRNLEQQLERLGEARHSTGPRRPVRGLPTTGPQGAIRVSTGPLSPVKATTGPQRSVTGTQSVRVVNRPATPRSNVGLLVGIGIVALLLIAIPLFIGGNNKTERLMNSNKAAPAVVPESQPPAKPASVAAPARDYRREREQLDQEWSEQKNFMSTNPEAFEQIRVSLDRLEQRMKELPGTAVLQSELEAARKDFRMREDALAEKHWQELEGQVEALVGAKDFDAALNRIETIEPRFQELLAAKRSARIAQLRKMVEETARPVLTSAAEALQQDRPDEGLAQLETLDGIKFSPLISQRNSLKEKLEAARDMLQANRERTAKEQAEQGWPELLKAFDQALLHNNDRATAQGLLEKALADPTFEPIKPRSEALAQVSAQEVSATGVLEALRKKIGETVSLRTRSGTRSGKLIRIENETIHLESGSVSSGVKFGDLSPEERKKWSNSERSDLTDSQRVALALQKLRSEKCDPQAAITLLEKAEQFPLRAHYLELAGIRLKQQREAQAEQEWAALESRLPLEIKSDTAERLLREVERYRTDFSETAFVKSGALRFEQFERKIKAGSGFNFADNGSFEQGSLEGWDIHPLTKVELVENDVQDGRYALKFISSEVAGVFFRKRVLIPRDTFLLVSFWQKALGGAEPILYFDIRDSGETIAKFNMRGVPGKNRLYEGRALDIGAWNKTETLLISRTGVLELCFCSALYRSTTAQPFLLDSLEVKAVKSPLGPDKQAKIFKNHAYRHYDWQTSFAIANLFCKSALGYLPRIDTIEEGRFVGELQPEGLRGWIGMERTSTGLQWHGGGAITANERFARGWAAMMLGQPFAGHYRGTTYNFEQIRGLEHHGFVCEWEPTQEIRQAMAQAKVSAIVKEQNATANELDPQKNWISNGDFEQGKIAEWNAHRNTTVAISKEKPRSGTYTMKAGANGTCLLMRLIEVPPNAFCHLKLWLRVKGGEGKRRDLRIHLTDHGRTLLDYNKRFAVDGSITDMPGVKAEEWHAHEVLFRSFGERVCLNLSLSEFTGQAFELHLDDLELRALPPQSFPTAEAVAFKGQKFQVLPFESNFATARSFCEAQGGHLAIINDREKHAFLSEIAKGQPENAFWVGLEYYNNEIYWIDGQPLELKEPSQLNIARLYEDYLPIANYDAAKGLIWCQTRTITSRFICEWPGQPGD